MAHVPICIHQPEHLPYPGFWRKLLLSRVWIALDDAQYQKGHYHNRNKIASNTASGWGWLQVPVKVAKHTSPIIDAYIASEFSPKKYMATIRQQYGRAAAAKVLFPQIEDALHKAAKHRKLWLLNIDLICAIADYLGIRLTILLSSEMGVPPGLDKTDRLIRLCRAAGATAYISGAGALAYIDQSLFEKSGLPLYIMPLHTDNYPRAGLSILDLLMNTPDANAALQYLQTGIGQPQIS